MSSYMWDDALTIVRAMNNKQDDKAALGSVLATMETGELRELVATLGALVHLRTTIFNDIEDTASWAETLRGGMEELDLDTP